MYFLEGTALGEFLRQLESMEGETLADKLASMDRTLVRGLSRESKQDYIQQTEKLRFFIAGLTRLERDSLLAPAPCETKTAIAA